MLVEPRRRWLARWAAMAVVLMALAVPTATHDLENTHVLIAFLPDGYYQIDILNDADWMWMRMNPGAERLPVYEERDRDLAGVARGFAEGVRMVFDGERVEPDTVEYVPPLETGPSGGIDVAAPGLMRLTGLAPAGARAFQFAYELVDDPYPLTISPGRGQPVTRWLMAFELSETFVIGNLQPMTRLQVSRQYLGLGFTHIVPKGLDHILFVIGLFLLSTKVKPLLLQVSAFTVAHTITLGLTIYGVFSLSPAIVEPLIALSIAYVAVENLVTTELKPWRVALVFAFGLLHGMGFAGVLAGLGLPRGEFLAALLTFNVGVEIGQWTGPWRG